MKMLRPILSTLAGCLVACGAHANPVGADVVSGHAGFDSHGNLLTITNTPGTIINWQGFSIGAGEITRFVQQGATSAVLNRIVGQDPSLILGALQSNGRVYLVNPNGIVFGAGARVDVNGLAASTLDIADDDFRAGRRVFDAGARAAGGIRNDGTIATPGGGQVYLIAPSVENNGLITAPGGEVLLAAGRHVALVDSASPDLHVVVSAPDDQAVNVGRIVAAGGAIGIYGALVNQRGVVDADSAVVGEDGRVLLKASRETLLEAGSLTSARGAGEGGTIHVLGDHVGLTGDAQVDASGKTGGGTVLVGGDLHGGNAGIANASAAYFGPDARIRADALESGTGGRVILWSDGATRAYGGISARGGALGGDGGFVETSGRGYLDFRGLVDTRSPHGAAGTLLLDPNDITIESGPPPATDTSLSGGSFNSTFSGGPASSVLTVSDLQAQLAMGNVTVSTAAGSGGPNGGRITVANGVTWNSSTTLSLVADTGIAINGTLTGGGDGRLLLTSNGGGISQTAPIDVTYLVVNSLGDVSLDGATNMVTNIAAQVGDANHLNHNFRFLNGQSLNVTSLSGVNGISVAVAGRYFAPAPDGVIALRTTSGILTQFSGAMLSAKAVYAEADSVILGEANAAGVIAGRLTGAPGSDGFQYTSAGGLIVDTVNGVAGIQSAGAPVVLAANAGDIAMNAAVNAGSGAVSLSAPGAVSGNVTGASVGVVGGNGISLTTQTGFLLATNAGGSAPIAITNTGALVLQNITQSGTGSITVDNTGPLTVASGQSVSSTSGSISLAAHSPLTVDGSVVSSAGGAIALSAGPSGSVADQLTINGSVATSPGTGVSVATSGPVTLSAGDAIHVAGTIAGNVTQQAFLNAPPPPPPPTLAQCAADPTLAGCASVLPTLAQCAATPTLAGCGAVLPSLAQCVASPALPGCGTVLPTLAQCTVAPATAGCQAVLPTLAQCGATPTLPGCGAILPSLAQCVAVPTTAGCQAVLPTLAQCTVTPALSGCGAVLPTLSQCALAPTTAGCQAVLPTLAQCTGTPTLSGCGAVLPTVAQCTATPSLAACSVVLPPVGACATAPTSPGCTAVLPPVIASSTQSQPVLQATNAVVNLVNTTIPKVVAGSDASSTSSIASGGSAKDDKKPDSTKDGTDKPGTQVSGAVKDEPAKKMYCN